MDRTDRQAPGWWQAYAVDTVVDTENLARQHREKAPLRQSLRRVVVVLVTAGLLLTLIRFLRTTELGSGGGGEFERLMRWAGISVAGYMLLPLLAIWLLGERPRSFGASRPGSLRWGRPYLILYLASVPFLYFASFLPHFGTATPFTFQGQVSRGGLGWPSGGSFMPCSSWLSSSSSAGPCCSASAPGWA